MADWTDDPNKVVPLFRQFDTPLDRWLRADYDRTYYSYPHETLKRHRAIVTHSEVFGGEPLAEEPDEAALAADSLLELTFSG